MTIRSHHEERRRDQNQQTWNEQRFQRNAVFSWSVSRLIAAARLDSRKFRFHLCGSLTPISYHTKAIFTTSPCRLYFPNDPRATFDPEARAEYFRLARKRDDAPFIMMVDGLCLGGSDAPERGEVFLQESLRAVTRIRDRECEEQLQD